MFNSKTFENLGFLIRTIIGLFLISLMGYIAFYISAWQGDYPFPLEQFIGIREAIKMLILFVLVIFFFLVGVWLSLFYKEFARMHPEFDYPGGKILMKMVIPLWNVFAFPVAVMRLINFMDDNEPVRYISRCSDKVKIALAFAYAGIMGILITLPWALEISTTIEEQKLLATLIFNSVILFFVLMASLGIFVVFNQLKKISTYRPDLLN